MEYPDREEITDALRKCLALRCLPVHLAKVEKNRLATRARWKKVDADSLNVGEEKLAGVERPASEPTWLRLRL